MKTFLDYITDLSGLVGTLTIFFLLIKRLWGEDISTAIRNLDLRIAEAWIRFSKTPRNFDWYTHLERNLNEIYGKPIFSGRSFIISRIHTALVLVLLGFLLFIYLVTQESDATMIASKSNILDLAYHSMIGLPLDIYWVLIIFDFISISFTRAFIKKMKSASMLGYLVLFIGSVGVSALAGGAAGIVLTFFDDLNSTVFSQPAPNFNVIKFKIFACVIATSLTSIYMVCYVFLHATSKFAHLILTVIKYPTHSPRILEKPTTFFLLILMTISLVLGYFLWTGQFIS